MKRKVWFFSLALGILLCIVGAANAASPCVYFGAEESGGGTTVYQVPVDVVTPQQIDGIRYLFLPAGWDGRNLRIYLTNADEATVNSVTYLSGQSIALTAGERYNIHIKNGATYVMKVMQSAQIPAVFLSTESGDIEALKQAKTVKESGQAYLLNADGSVEYAGMLTYIRTRGNASFYYPKKSFQIKLKTSSALWGMNADRKWNLLANYLDKSLIRNTLAYAIARYSNAYSFVPGTQPVDLYLNHKYYGSFLLTEKCEIAKGRLDINNLEKETEQINSLSLDTYKSFGDRLYAQGAQKGVVIENDPTDITGGYLLLANSRVYYAHEISGFVTSKGQAFTVDQPKYASRSQIAYLSEIFRRLENALFSEDGTDPETGLHWDEMIDKTSFVNRYVLAETVADYDGQKPYFYKDSDNADAMLYCAPVWDQDNIFGANESYNKPKRFYIMNDTSLPYLWFPQAMKLPDFKEEAIRLYNEVYAPALRVLLGDEDDPTGTLKSIDEYAQEVRASAEMDNIRWPISKNIMTNFNSRTGTTPQKNIDYLKTFIRSRLAFFDAQWGRQQTAD